MTLLVLLVAAQIKVTIQVVDSSGKPMSEVSVVGVATERLTRPTSPPPPSIEPASSATNRQGKLTLDLPPGEHLMTLVPEDAERVGTMTISVLAKTGRTQRFVFRSTQPRTRVEVRASTPDGGLSIPVPKVLLPSHLWAYCYESLLLRFPGRDSMRLTAQLRVTSRGEFTHAHVMSSDPPEFGECALPLIMRRAVGAPSARDAHLDVRVWYGVD